MSSLPRRNSKRHSGFIPFDSLTNSSSSPNEVVGSRYSLPPRDKHRRNQSGLWHSPRAKSEAIPAVNLDAAAASGSFDTHSAKRQKLSSSKVGPKNLHTLDADEESPIFPTSSNAQHISYHSRKHRQQSEIVHSFNGAISSFRNVEDRMNPTIGTRKKLSVRDASSGDGQFSAGSDDELILDFGTRGMESNSADKTDEKFVHDYMNKPVAVKKPGQLTSVFHRRGTSEGLTQHIPTWQIHGRVYATPERDQEYQDAPEKKPSAKARFKRSATAGAGQRTGYAVDDDEPSLRSQQKLGETFTRDKSTCATLGAKSFDGSEQTNHKAGSITVQIPARSESQLSERNQRAQETRPDTKQQPPVESQPAKTQKAINDYGLLKKIKTKKEAEKRKCYLEHLFINSKDFPDKVYMECDQALRTFKFYKMNGEIALHDTKREILIGVTGDEPLVSALFTNNDESGLVRLEKKNKKKESSFIYMLFTHVSDLVFLRDKLRLFDPKFKFEYINKDKLEKAYERRNTGQESKKEDSSKNITGKSKRLTRSQGQQDTIEAGFRHKRPMPYSEAMKREKSLGKPLQYPPGASRGEIATVEHGELEHLQPDAFLNDSLVWFGIRYMLERNPESKTRVHCFNTYFYPSLSMDSKSKGIDYNAVKRWTSKQKVDIFSRDFVIVPINQELHWHLAIICNLNNIVLHPREDSQPVPRQTNGEPRETSIMTRKCAQLSLSPNRENDGATSPVQQEFLPGLQEYVDMNIPSQTEPDISSAGIKQEKKGLKSRSTSKTPLIISLDSLGGAHRDVFRNLKDYLIEEAKEKHSADIETPLTKVVKEIPKQNNFCDCGLFLIEYVKRFMDDPDVFVDMVLNDKMNLDYWPHTVAYDLRDNFKEIVCKEWCKQNNISPVPAPDDSTNDVDQASNQTSTMEASNINGSCAEAKSTSDSGMFEANEIKPHRREVSESDKSPVPLKRKSSSPAGLDSDLGVIDEKGINTRQDSLQETMLSPTNSNREEKHFHQGSIFLDNQVDTEISRPSTRGKRI